MRINNTTDIPDDLIRDVIRFVRPAGISNFDVEVRNSRSSIVGRAYSSGSGYHSRAVPFIVARIGPPKFFPSKTSAQGAYLETWIGTRVEGLVFLVAHELRHLWQGKSGSRRKGMVWGAKGKFSERDADAYAIHKLREYRRAGLNHEKK